MAFSVKSKQSQYIRRVNHDCRRRRAGPGGVTDATARANQVRWFDPTVGRWLSEDPAAADENLYRYCGNAPTDGTDPSGMAEHRIKQPGDPVDAGWTVVKQHNARGARGNVTWRIATSANKDSAILFEMWFIPDKNCPNMQILNVQMILEDTVGGKPFARYKPTGLPPAQAQAVANYNDNFSTKPELGNGPDIPPWQNHLYYGSVKLNKTSGMWESENREQVGRGGPNGIPAYMKDMPSSPDARKNKGSVVLKFESAVVCDKTNEVLGAVRWGFKITDAPASPIELLDGDLQNFNLKVSPDFKGLVSKAGFAKPITIHLFPPTDSAFGGTSAWPDE